jgi:hypothetical protein
MPVINLRGRYPWGPGVKFDGARVSHYEVLDDHATITLDDRDHDDFWMQIDLPASLIEAWYHWLQAKKADAGVRELLNQERLDGDGPEFNVGPLAEQYLTNQATKATSPNRGNDDQSQQPTTIGE